MGRFEKLLKRFQSKPKDFAYDELKRLLDGFGYEEAICGKTSGSRVAFMHSKKKHIIRLHKPHPRPVLKRYQIDLIIEELTRKGVIE